MSDDTLKVGIISCSGEEIAEGTISRLATRRVLGMLRPGNTVTLCLPLLLSGNEQEREFARDHPTITIDGCEKRCAQYGTEKYGGPVSAALVVNEILNGQCTTCARSGRDEGDADKEAVWVVAEAIAATVDHVLAEAGREGATEGAAEAGCACSRPLPGGKIMVAGEEVTIPGLPVVFDHLRESGVQPGADGAPQVLETVAIYFEVPDAQREAYQDALGTAYAKHCQ